jgi:hypothetical protein
MRVVQLTTIAITSAPTEIDARSIREILQEGAGNRKKGVGDWEEGVEMVDTIQAYQDLGVSWLPPKYFQ